MFLEALKVFDSLKKKKVFRDYAIGGAAGIPYCNEASGLSKSGQDGYLRPV